MKVRKFLFNISWRFGVMEENLEGWITPPPPPPPDQDRVKYDSLTGKSVIDSTISQLGPYMKKLLGINNEKYIDTLLSKKYFLLKLTNCQPQITTDLTTSQVRYCVLVTLIETYHSVISFTSNQRTLSIKS